MKTKILKSYLSFPLLSCFFFTLLNNVIIPPAGYSFITPCLSISCFVYWVFNRSPNFYNIHIFFLGIFNDLIFGTPLGGSSLIYLVIKSFLFYIDSRFNFQNFIFEIIKGCLGISIYYLLLYFFIIIYFDLFPSISYFIMSFLLTLFSYPIVYVVFNWITKYIEKYEFDSK